jgi:hypothetical protein
MSVLDELRALENQVVARMKELRPLIDEYRELEQVAQRLGLRSDDAGAEAPTRIDPTPRQTRGRSHGRVARRAGGARIATAASAGGATFSTERSASKPTSRKPSARPGLRHQRVLELVRRRPGITVSEVGGRLGVDPTSLYRVVHRLKEQGAINKRGRELRPA